MQATGIYRKRGKQKWQDTVRREEDPMREFMNTDPAKIYLALALWDLHRHERCLETPRPKDVFWRRC